MRRGLSAEDRTSMRALVEKRDAETLTAAEWQELAALSDRLELLHADRLEALTEFATLRGVTLEEVMKQLGIQFPDHFIVEFYNFLGKTYEISPGNVAEFRPVEIGV